ncbi:MAG TPA: class I SAM-dependent methyltransferase [Acidimicrobiales bacterium]
MAANQQQAEAWNGPESTHWVDNADRYDRQVAAVSDALFAFLALRPDDAVLDVGCGAGAVARRAAHVARRVLGADISGPLVAVAVDRARAESLTNAEFVVADAQTHPFGEGAFDVVVSQFGLMFFDQPATAFASLRRSLASGGRIAFTCWQEMEANEWLSVVADAVARHVALRSLGGLAGGPGMFALKDPSEIAALMDQVGFLNVDIEPVSTSVLIGGGGTLDGSVDFLLGMGMVRGLLSHLDPDGRTAAVETIRGSLADRYEPGVGVRLGAAVWLVSATT